MYKCKLLKQKYIIIFLFNAYLNKINFLFEKTDINV